MEKTALVLSGGGSRGGYQVGVWQALRELGIEIDIVTGTSVGAINASMVVTGEFEQAKALWIEAETNMIFDLDNDSLYNAAKTEKIKNTHGFMGMPMQEALSYAKNALIRGGAGSGGMLEILEKYLNLDDFFASPIEYGMVTAELPTFKGHYLYKEELPKDLAHQYILASASCFPAARYCVIDEKKFVDGGYADNLPIDMAMDKGATRIIAVDLEAVGVVKKESLLRAKTQAKEFQYISSLWDLGNFLCFDPETNRRNLTLGYLDAMKAFKQYQGKYYTFPQNTFPENQMRRADAAAHIFDLDPLVVYSKDQLDAALRPKILDAQIALGKKTQPLHTKLRHETLTIFIAESLKEHQSESPFLKKYVLKTLREEVLAASYLLRNNLLFD
ncbi:MAG: patatin-like phospholipase family protein [Anaerovoracaceae bacterium]